MKTSNTALMTLGLSALMTTNLACGIELPELRSNNNPQECEVRLNGIRNEDIIVTGTTLSVETVVNLDCDFFDALETPVVEFELWDYGSNTSEPEVWGPFSMQMVEGQATIWTATTELEIPTDLPPGEHYSFGATVTLVDQMVGIGHSEAVTVLQAN